MILPPFKPQMRCNEGLAQMNCNRQSVLNTSPLDDRSDGALSNKVITPARGTDAADKRTLQIIRDYGLARVVVGSHTVGNFTPPSNYPPKALKGKKLGAVDPAEPVNDNALACWDHTGDRLKFGMAMQSLSGRGNAFTLILSPKRILEALGHAKGFSRCLAGFIDRVLKKHLGRVPDYGFVVEATARGKLHIHGGVECTHDELPVIKEALRYAGGKDWKPCRRGEKQVHFRELFFPLGWTRYSFQDRPKAKRLIKGTSLVITNPLRRRAKQTYVAVKAIID